MKPEKDQSGRNCCSCNYQKGILLFLLTSTFSLCMLWSLAKSDGIIQMYTPSKMQYVEPSYVGYSDTSEDVRFKTHNTSPMATATLLGNQKTVPVNQHNFRYIIKGNNTCATGSNADVFLMVIVCVAPAKFKHRDVIRKTWGSITKHDQEVRLMFLMGKPKDDATQDKIHNESKQFSDIVQEDFVDSYRNLSIKSVAMLKWTMSFCNRAKYVLKVDDDMFVNIPYLIKVLKHKNLTNCVIGDLFKRSRPIRDPASKWHTPLSMYKEEEYPTYLSGTAYVISGDIVSKLYNASLSIPLFWLEDVYITGLCRKKIGAEAVADFGFTYTHRSPTGCDYRHIISGHKNTLDEIKKIWHELQDPQLKCSN